MSCLSTVTRHLQLGVQRLSNRHLCLLPLRSRPTLLLRCTGRKMACRDLADLAAVKPMIGVCQMTSTADKEINFATCKALIERARSKGAQMVFLPEACDYIAASKEDAMAMAEPLSGDLMTRYRQVARDNQIWLSIGGFHQKAPEGAGPRILNTHVLIGSDGEIHGTYCKTHLFDLDIAGKVHLCESDYTLPGSRIHPPVETPVGKVGMATCYDLRFPELSLVLAQQGADILTFPSAFTIPTGLAHWQVLLQSRAIETQTYVAAAAQTGKHNDKRSSYGHALVVDPWGAVVAQCQEGTDVCVAEVDLAYRQKVCQQMPVWQHRRHDLYGHLHSIAPASTEMDSQETYTFGHVKVKSSQVFYRTRLSYCFVNVKPVVTGHVLVSSLRPVPRLADLSVEEVADLFQAVQRVAGVLEKHFGASSTTCAIQDGPDAGQTVQHVHVHVMPRRKGDFVRNDEIYDELQKHDKDMGTGLRSEEEMNNEASQLRAYFL